MQGHLNNAAQVFVNKILYIAAFLHKTAALSHDSPRQKLVCQVQPSPLSECVIVRFGVLPVWSLTCCLLKINQLNNFTSILACCPLPLFSYENIGSMKQNLSSKLCQQRMIKAAKALLCCYFCVEYVGYTLRAFLSP